MDSEKLLGERGIAQFFFEIGYGACFAEAFIRNGAKTPWPMSDAEVERAWEMTPETYDDPAEFDRYKALADVAEAGSPTPENGLREALERVEQFQVTGDPPAYEDAVGAMRLLARSALQHNTGERDS
jgi:hypothetical protein